jgi:hypothetical protein
MLTLQGVPAGADMLIVLQAATNASSGFSVTRRISGLV